MEAEERKARGFWGTIGGVITIAGGVVCIVATWGAATPIVAYGGFAAGTGTVIFGAHDTMSGVEDYVYGSYGDITTLNANEKLIKNAFGGNETAYSVVKESFSLATGIFTGFGEAGATLTIRNGATIVGKETINMGFSHGSNWLADKTGMDEGEKFILNYVTGKLSGKGLDGLDSKFNISGTPDVDVPEIHDHQSEQEVQHLQDLGIAERNAIDIVNDIAPLDPDIFSYDQHIFDH